MPVSVAVFVRKNITQNTKCYTWLICDCKIVAFVYWRTGQWSLSCSAVEEKERLDVYAASSYGQPFVNYVWYCRYKWNYYFRASRMFEARYRARQLFFFNCFIDLYKDNMLVYNKTWQNLTFRILELYIGVDVFESSLFPEFF